MRKQKQKQNKKANKKKEFYEISKKKIKKCSRNRYNSGKNKEIAKSFREKFMKKLLEYAANYHQNLPEKVERLKANLD